MTPNVLEADRITKMFGSFTAVEAATFLAGAGEILAVLGPNGAGKTTLLKMIRGLLRPTAGRILIKGADPEVDPDAARALGYMSQKFSLYPLLTGLENLEFFGGISDLSPRDIRRVQDEARGRIPEAILRRKTKDIPPGFKQSIALCACLMTDPEIVLLDEPTSGVGPDNRRRFWLEIYGLKRAGRTILVATHDLHEAEYADRILIIEGGRIVLDRRTRDLVRRAEGRTMDVIYQEAVGHGPRT